MRAIYNAFAIAYSTAEENEDQTGVYWCGVVIPWERADEIAGWITARITKPLPTTTTEG